MRSKYSRVSSGIKSINKKRYFALALCVIVITAAFAGAGVSEENQSVVQSSLLVWVERGNDSSDLYFSYYDGKKWGSRKQLTKSKSVNYNPSVQLDDKGQYWIAWSSAVKKGIVLNFAVVKHGLITREPEIIKTGLSSNVGPYIEIDSKNQMPLIVWSGSNGRADDVFIARWKNNAWSNPEQVNPKNKISDYLPKIYIDLEGIVTVEWKATGPEGPHLYRKVMGSSGLEKYPAGANTIKKQINQKGGFGTCFPQLPRIGSNLEMSTIAFKCAGGSRSQQVRYPAALNRSTKE